MAQNIDEGDRLTRSEAMGETHDRVQSKAPVTGDSFGGNRECQVEGNNFGGDSECQVVGVTALLHTTRCRICGCGFWFLDPSRQRA